MHLILFFSHLYLTFYSYLLLMIKKALLTTGRKIVISVVNTIRLPVSNLLGMDVHPGSECHECATLLGMKKGGYFRRGKLM